MEFAAADLADAYMHFNVRPEELAECVSVFGDSVIIWLALCFGLSGAPLLWCRFAAALARLVVAAADLTRLRLELYLDDPLWTLWGTKAQRDRQLAISLWICLAMGTKFSWKKAARGSSLIWIGIQFTLECKVRFLLVSIPIGMVKDILLDVAALQRPGRVPLKWLRKLTGRLSWAAGVLPRIRWAINVLYAVYFSAEREAQRRPRGTAGRPSVFRSGDGPSRTRKAVTPFLFDSSRVRLPLQWVAALFRDFERTPFVRRIAWDPVRPKLGVVLDASPWGVAGVLFHTASLRPLEFFADEITSIDESHLAIASGNAAAQQAAECLALVIAIKCWARFLRSLSAAVAVRSDSTVAGALGNRLSSSSPTINFLGAELALELERHDLRDLVVQHIPGVWNTTADALSRLYAPEPKAIPDAVKDVKRRRLPPRDAHFYRLPAVGLNSTLWTGVPEGQLFSGLAFGL